MKVNNKTYDILRFIAETLIPALTTFIGGVLIALKVNNAEVVITIMAGFDTLIGTIVKKLRDNYNEEGNNE